MPKPFHVPGSGPELSRGDDASERADDTDERHDASGLSGLPLEVVPKRKRKQYSASEKLRIVKAADAAVASGVRGALEKLLRKEGIYSSHLSAWRQQLAARGAEGLTARKPGRKPKLDEKDRELLRLKKELAKTGKQLRLAKALIELQKKAHAVLGIALPEFDRSELDDEVSS
jgi:transposase-like protein